ncbi:MAG: myo-inosose-2 dehydratase [Myxococcaceae bacterium]|nr:myo-inosose-2 dehydratase [Myxococcaceae bacterium]
MAPHRIRIGINPLTWTNDDMPELGAETPLATCLREAKEAGYDGIELGNKFPRRSEVLGPLLESHGLRLVSGWYSSALLERSVEAEIAAIQAHLSLLRALGCDVLILCETTGAIHGDRTAPLSKRPRLSEAGWRTLTRGLTHLGNDLARQGVRLAYHHHMGTWVQTEEEIDRLMAETGPNVHLLLDTGHLTFAGGRPAVMAARHARRIAHVHAKDVRPAVLADALARDLPFLQAVLNGVFTVPGDGSVDYHAVFGALTRVPYRGWLVVEAEQDPKKAHPATFARMGFRNVAALMRCAGLVE